MSFQLKLTPDFERSIKRLAKRYRSLPTELNQLMQELRVRPETGKSIGHGCYKIRLAIASKGTGKRGGARVITYVRVVQETVFLLAIYDKSERASISDQQVRELIAALVE